MKLDCKVNVVTFLNHLAAYAPQMRKKEEIQIDFTWLSMWIGNELATEFLSTLNEIRLELVPKHATDMYLINAFWDELICPVTGNPKIYLKSPRVLSDLIDQFSHRWKQPLSEYEVIYSVDYLAIGQEPIILDQVEFFAPTDETLTERAIPKSEIANWSKKGRTITLAITKVEAASRDIAFEAGREQLERAINLLRVSALYGLSGRIATDELLQFKVSGHYIVRPLTDGESPWWMWGMHRPFGPLVDEMGDAIRRGIDRMSLQVLSDCPEDIRNRILQSIYWISRCAIHESDDHKIVDLCTALEILLLPEEKFVRNKGTVIAVRYKLLHRGFGLNPSAVKWMYDRRNDVVHGSPLPVVGPRDTWNLRSVCYTTVDLIIRASARQPNVMTLEDLIATVESEDELDTFVWQVEIGMNMGSFKDQLAKEARNRLKKLRSVGR